MEHTRTKVATYQQPAKDPGKFFHVHMVSDASGETLAAIAKAAAVQYSGVRALKHSHPFVRNKRHLDRVVQQIEASPGVVLYTIVNRELGLDLERQCEAMNIPCVAVLAPLLKVFEAYLGTPSTPVVGGQHVLDLSCIVGQVKIAVVVAYSTQQELVKGRVSHADHRQAAVKILLLLGVLALLYREDWRADHQQAAAKDLDRKLGKKVGQRCYVAIQPLDHLAGCVLLVEAHVQVEHMGSQVGAHLVGCGPPDLLGQVGGSDAEDLG